MTKKELVDGIAEELGLDQTLTRRVVQKMLDRMIDSILREGRLELRNFGVFEIRTRSSRKARNPKTNEEVMVPPKRVITFQAGKNVACRLGRPGETCTSRQGMSDDSV